MTTVFWTVLAGVITFVAGQLLVKLIIEPVQELRKTIGAISHSLIQYANVIQNPGVPPAEVMKATSEELRRLSSQLQSHLYLVPGYRTTSRLFGLPTHEQLREASSMLIGLSNSVYRDSGNVYEANARRVETICDSLGIFMADHDRLPKERNDV